MLLPYYVMGATDSLVMAFYGVEGVCYYAWAVILVVVMVQMCGWESSTCVQCWRM
jgi:hypothetical protein